MQSQIPALRDLVLIGGGHSHVQVLKKFAMNPVAGVRITLVSESGLSPYSGMLPGYISGAYSEKDINIALGPLCVLANARLICAKVVGIDPLGNTISFADRPSLRFDILSVNCGAEQTPITGSGIRVKPLNKFIPEWSEVKKAYSDATSAHSIAVIGAGAGGAELALAFRASLSVQTLIYLVGPRLLPGHGGAAVRQLKAVFAEKKIHYVEDHVASEEPNPALKGVDLKLRAGAQSIYADQVFWVTDVRAPQWLKTASIDQDERGFLRVDDRLRSVSHPHIFAAGDVAHLVDQERPKAGVYAVRAGPVLADNLALAVQGLGLEGARSRFRPQRYHLNLIGCGDGTAIASWGPLATRGRIWWRLKRRIDEQFMSRFSDLPVMQPPAHVLPSALAQDLPDDLMRCGGCGAKLAADPLRRVLARLPAQVSVNLKLGIGDDAAEVVNTGATTLATVDGFRSMVSDPYLFGRIAAHHSLNDIFAMAAKPSAALAFVTVPLMAEAMMEDELFQLMSGLVDVLNAHDVVLAGGHSAEGAELNLGLTVLGASSGKVSTKSAAQIGHGVILTKPLGTGVVLAGDMRGQVDSKLSSACLASMDQSNWPSIEVLVAHKVGALTDVTGFGLAGHLGEILRGAGCGVKLRLANVPMLPGAEDLVRQGIASSLQNANALVLQDYTLVGIDATHPGLQLLVDPQTSGGMLATLPQEQIASCLEQLNILGYQAVQIGEICAPSVMEIH
ncbi:MAG: selenide, water dikinase SelD [Pseudomonadales bacterium]|nr:selenide, water dikinase SelD [Pseudomonadales bacterium]